MRHLSVRSIVACLALSFATVLAAAPASAAESAAPPAPAKVVSLAGTAPSGNAAAAECSTTSTVVFGIQWGGRRLCSYGYGGHQLGSGTLQVYVVGTDHQVWTKWRNPNGTYSTWRVLNGGSVKHGNYYSIHVTVSSAGYPLLRVVGNEAAGRFFCIVRNASGWTNWYVC